MALVLTNVYLENAQKKTLERLAKKNHSNLSVEIRHAVDVYSMGLSIDDLKMLDETTQRAKVEIDEMNATLDIGLARAERFFAEMDRLKEGK